jgi:hypothetical protein
VFLLSIQPAGFSLAQLPTRNPFINPCFLIRLTLIDHWCVSLPVGTD